MTAGEAPEGSSVTTMGDGFVHARQRGLLVLLVGLLCTSGLARRAQAESRPRFRTVAEFAPCTDQRQADECLAALTEYVDARPDQAFAAGKAVTMRMTHWVAIPFFEKALALKADPVRCKDDRLELAVVSALGQPRNGENGAILTSARSILGDRCWNELLAPLSRRIEADRAGYLTRSVCRVFAEKNHSAPACHPRTKPLPAKEPEAVWEALDPRKLQVEGAVKVFKGSGARRVSLVKVKDKPYYLVKFEGFRGPWNGKVVLHREEPASSGVDYWTELEGRRYVSIVARRPSGSDAYSWQVFPRRGEGPFAVVLDPAASKSAKGEALRTEFAR